MNSIKLDKILLDHKLCLQTNYKKGNNANLSEADLSGANLYEVDLSGADLSGANLYEADLSGANLSGTNLSGANLSGANLSGANLAGTNLSGANLYRADLFGANLSGANLAGTNLSGANLSAITGKLIISFQAGRHFAYYCDNFIKIGCEYHLLKYWLKNYKIIGKDADYSDLEIQIYGNWIKSLKGIHDAR